MAGPIHSSNNLPTRITLLERAQSGKDHPDWNELLQYYEPFIRRFLVGMGTSPSDIDDVCQQVLSRVWQELVNYRRVEEKARFRTWLTRLILNVATNDYWKRKRAKRVGSTDVNDLEELPYDSPEIEQRIEAEWQRHVVHLALDRMKQIFSGNAIEVFLRSTEGESSAQISEDLGVSVQSVYVLKNRVKKRLAHEVKLLREQLEFPDSTS
ncbi:ECF sigma factor [Rhodopirellula maiorica SM1]|uniref:ECF sigma factor n=1 Tax=Rhodopirellula maiorica SM1 TaxID=1265738 RepID=M5RFC1_9BACT|nr:sigma-70 family RNA polymerase sigma factor [Rhodopirellula maiorica]EMI18065.1 ECF sigma factor [Rhodopirellula maiorica SM1]